MAPVIYASPSTIETSLNGELYCAACCMLYMAAVSNDEEILTRARELNERHSDMDWIHFSLPNPDVYKNGRYKIQFAVTVAPSFIRPDAALPVCFAHILPHQRTGIGSNGSSLIPGKKYEVPK